MSDSLLKAKIITRNGVPYYADGKHAGKRVGSVRSSANKDQATINRQKRMMDSFKPNSQIKEEASEKRSKAIAEGKETRAKEAKQAAARESDPSKKKSNLNKISQRLIEESGFKLGGSGATEFYSRKKANGINEFIILNPTTGEYNYMDRPNGPKETNQSTVLERIKN